MAGEYTAPPAQGPLHVTPENLGVTAQGLYALLDARATRIIEADQGSAIFHREIHELADLGRVGARERSTKNRKILGKNIHDAAIDFAKARDHAIAQGLALFHPEAHATVGGEAIEFLKGAGIEE